MNETMRFVVNGVMFENADKNLCVDLIMAWIRVQNVRRDIGRGYYGSPTNLEQRTKSFRILFVDGGSEKYFDRGQMVFSFQGLLDVTYKLNVSLGAVLFIEVEVVHFKLLSK